MKKRGIWMGCMAVGVFFLLGTAAQALDKIGFVNVSEVMLRSDMGKKAQEDLKKSFEKDRIVIQDREAELKKLREELDKQRSILNEATLREKDANFQRKYRHYETLAKDFNDDLQAKEVETLRKLYPQVMKVVRAIAEKEKYTAIFDPFAVQGPLPYIPYFDKEHDLTQRVIVDFNKANKP